MVELAGSLLVVEGRDLADADALEDLEAALHLGHRPLQSARRLLGLGDNRDVQVRQAVIAGKLDALGVDHDEANVLGKAPHKQRHDDGVDHDGLTGAGGAGDEKVGHLREVGNDGLALRVAADGKLERSALNIGQNIAEVDVLALGVGNLNAHERGAGNRREDADRLRGQRQRDIVLEIGDTADALALTRLDLERGHGGTGDPSDNAGVEPKLVQRGLQGVCGLLELLVRRGGDSGMRIVTEHAERRQLQLAVLGLYRIGRGRDARF
ncbi:Uncharacterised protein [Collinsella intestinalis]|nr:Uncharacterised protein [Collinsella intestinalis]